MLPRYLPALVRTSLEDIPTVKTKRHLIGAMDFETPYSTVNAVNEKLMKNASKRIRHHNFAKKIIDVVNMKSVAYKKSA